MNKIANWVFGSFFRTIGRVLVFIILGVIIANFIDFGSLKDNFSITDLFLDKVKASSTDVGFMEDIKLWDSVQIYNSTANPLCTSGSSNYRSCTWEKQYNFDHTYNYTGGEGQYLVFRFYYMYGYDNSSTDPSIITYMQPTATLRDNQGAQYNCQIENGLIICPLINNRTYSNLYLKGTFIGNILDINIRWQIDNWATRYRNILFSGNSQIQNAINQQTQQQQQQHQETQNYLEDTNTTNANSQGESFITNFNNNTHGLTGIITAPLNAIQSIASSTCSTLVLPLPFVQNKSLNLPCMSAIYSQYFGAFYTMYQGIILALISYWVCIRIFTLVKGFKDPDDDKIEVMDL